MKYKKLLILIGIVLFIMIILCIIIFKMNAKSTTDSKEDMEIQKNELKSMERKKYDVNQFTIVQVNDIDLATGYLKSFINNILSNPQEAYNSLKKEYREKRFYNKYENFVEYVQYIGNDWYNIKLDSYLVNNEGKQFVCIDNYGHQYIFDIIGSVMEYEVTMDEYTLTEKEYYELYEKKNERMKATMNIDKVFKMINYKDYNHLYEKLDQNFKNNFFPDINDFIEYIENEFYKYNDKKYGKYIKEGNVHSYTLTVTDKTEENLNEIEVIIMVKLLDNNDFVFTIPFNH